MPFANIFSNQSLVTTNLHDGAFSSLEVTKAFKGTLPVMEYYNGTNTTINLTTLTPLTIDYGLTPFQFITLSGSGVLKLTNVVSGANFFINSSDATVSLSVNGGTTVTRIIQPFSIIVNGSIASSDNMSIYGYN